LSCEDVEVISTKVEEEVFKELGATNSKLETKDDPEARVSLAGPKLV